MKSTEVLSPDDENQELCLFAAICCNKVIRAAPDQLYTIEISCHGQPLVIIDFESSMGSCRVERQKLGVFSLYDDIVVHIGLQDAGDGDVDTAEHVAIPLLCFDRDKPSPMLLQRGPIEVNFIFDLEVAQTAANSRGKASKKGSQSVDFCEEECKYDPDSLSAPIRVLTPRRSVLTVHTSDLYQMTKRVLSDLVRAQKARLAQFLRILRTLCFYLLDGSTVVALMVVDLNDAALQRLDALVAQSLTSLDARLDAAGRLVLEALQLLVYQLKRQRGWAEAALVGTARTAFALASPALRVGWALGKPLALRGRSLARPLLGPLLDRAHQYVSEHSAEQGPATALLEDGLCAVRDFMYEGRAPRS